MKTWEKQLMKHILNEKYLGETDKVKIQKEDKKSFLQSVANFHQIGEMIFSNAKLKEVSETLSNIVQQAEAITMQESENWFDNVTVSRHMKQMNEAYKVFEKTANEISNEKAIGWFQGRMEFGPRALGGRSILGDPRSEKMQKNLKK